MLSFHVEKNHLCRQNWQKHDSSTEIFLTPLPWLLMVHHLANANSSSFAANYTTRQKHEDDGIELCMHWELALSFYYLKKKIKLKYLSVYFTCENHSNIKNFLVTFCFANQTVSLLRQSCQIKWLIKWISRCLFTMLPWRHKVNALWLVHSKTKGPFGITS